MINKKSFLNVFSTLLLQIVAIINGLIIPKLILQNFGSDVNGLITSLTQFLNYISLIEGGVSSVIMASLYTPLYEKSVQKISSVVVAANKFFKKIAYIFIVYTILIAILYPFLIDTSFNWNYIFSLTLILSVGLFIQYYFSLTWRLLLQADRKVYISSSVQIIAMLLNTIFTILSINIINDIHFVKLIASFSFVIQPILYSKYVNNNYMIDLSTSPNEKALSQRWDGFGINIAAFFHGNTDIVVLTIFSTLKNVLIYSVYNLVVTGIKSLITSISSGLVPTLGNYYAEGNERKLNKSFDFYETIIFFITFTVYTCAVLLIVPFILIYTKGIYDANYQQEIFSLLLILSMAMFCLREPYVNMAYIAAKFKEISKYAYIEALINIIFSIIFVYSYGLNGVALGTFFSISYRTICQIIYLKNNILYRSPLISIKKFLIFGFGSFLGYLLCRNIFLMNFDLTWFNWIVFAFKNSSVIFVINSILIYVFLKKDLQVKREE